LSDQNSIQPNPNQSLPSTPLNGEGNSDPSTPKNPSPWLIVWAGLSICLPVLLLYIYSCSSQTIQIAGFELKQILGNQDIDAMLAELDEPELPSKSDNTSTTNPQTNTHSNVMAMGDDSTLSFINQANKKPFSLIQRDLLLIPTRCSGRIHKQVNCLLFLTL
jgi:hypothetical protein